MELPCWREDLTQMPLIIELQRFGVYFRFHLLSCPH